MFKIFFILMAFLLIGGLTVGLLGSRGINNAGVILVSGLNMVIVVLAVLGKRYGHRDKDNPFDDGGFFGLSDRIWMVLPVIYFVTITILIVDMRFF